MRCILIKEVSLPFDTVLKKIPRELKRHGFQLLSTINIDKELHNYLGVDFSRCAILTISNLQLSYKLLLREKESALLQFMPLFIFDKAGKTSVCTFKPTQLFPILQSNCREDEASVLEKKIEKIMVTCCKKSPVKDKAGNLLKAVA